MSVSVSASPDIAGEDIQESGFSHLMNRELYPVREKVVGKYCEKHEYYKHASIVLKIM